MPGDLADAKRAAERAVEFLLGSRFIEPDASGNEPPQGVGWRDFVAFGVPSDEWVTAYTACALAEAGNRQCYYAAEGAWQWLIAHSQENRPGLGYTRRTPQDADSTVWGCRLAAAIGQSSAEWTAGALRYLQGLARTDGGIATFAEADLYTLGLGNAADTVAGWTISHECVTAAAAWLPEVAHFTDAAGFLARRQQLEGFWRAYWWSDVDYATAHAIESLARLGAYNETIDRAVYWLSRSPCSRSAFVLALRVLGISRARSLSFKPPLRELLALQLPNGSWPTSARLRIPPPYVRNPAMVWNWHEHHDGVASILLDRQAIFTTATALRALSSCLTH
jgi:hypothetical protein